MDYSLLRIGEFTSLLTEVSAIVTTYLMDKIPESSHTSSVEISGGRREGRVITIQVTGEEGRTLGTITTTVRLQKSPDRTHIGLEDGVVRIDLTRGTVTTQIRLNQEFLVGIWESARAHYYSKNKAQVPSAQLLQIRTGQVFTKLFDYCRERQLFLNGGFVRFHSGRGNGTPEGVRSFRPSHGLRSYSPEPKRARTY